MFKMQLRSKMFFGTDGIGPENASLDAATKLDKFLEENQHNIEIISIDLKFEYNDEIPSSHAILLIYKEKQLIEENLKD